MPSDTKKRIGILRGGAGKYYKTSLQKGGEIISHITDNLGDKYKTFDILIDQDYLWHINGVPINPSDLTNRVDVVWNTSHPSFSNILDSLAIPNLRAGSFSSVLENSKEMLREHMKKIGVSMPRSIILPVYQKDFDACPPSQVGSRRGPIENYAIKKAKEVFEKFGSPWIVKSFTEDTNMGIHLAKTFPELVEAIEDGAQHEKSILVEEFIEGKVASVHSVVGFRGDLSALPSGRGQAGDVYTFPLGNSFGNFSNEEKEKMASLVKDLHEHIGVRHYLKSDFILNKRGKVYLLQVESIPDLKPDSHFSQVCALVGAKPHHVVEHMLEQV
jgi:D-alanine-D-alanine ligase-like ATP-grasp enzyme